MQFVDAIEQSISLFVPPAAPPAATQRKSWRWPESLLWTAESELREDATTGSMLLMRTHSAMTTVAGTLPGGCVLPALGLGAAPLASAVACPARLRARPAQAHAA